jgi:SpoVK/Ycf46/Vps4 family AAA+-type ATPase
MYVGEAEKNIALAFKEAKREGAVLQIDEADSFLQARENAQRSWEVTQVNELLTQMENFEGVFIASTNFMDNFDSAAMRRFDMKLELKPLTEDQSVQMFKEVFKKASNEQLDEAILRTQIKGLDQLTPGDFAAVSRKIDIMDIEPTPELLINNLKEECSYKPSYRSSNGIGFLSSLH